MRIRRPIALLLAYCLLLVPLISGGVQAAPPSALEVESHCQEMNQNAGMDCASVDEDGCQTRCGSCNQPAALAEGIPTNTIHLGAAAPQNPAPRSVRKSLSPPLRPPKITLL